MRQDISRFSMHLKMEILPVKQLYSYILINLWQVSFVTFKTCKTLFPGHWRVLLWEPLGGDRNSCINNEACTCSQVANNTAYRLNIHNSVTNFPPVFFSPCVINGSLLFLSQKHVCVNCSVVFDSLWPHAV